MDELDNSIQLVAERCPYLHRLCQHGLTCHNHNFVVPIFCFRTDALRFKNTVHSSFPTASHGLYKNDTQSPNTALASCCREHVTENSRTNVIAFLIILLAIESCESVAQIYKICLYEISSPCRSDKLQCQSAFNLSILKSA